jgi:hypothetical protein
LAAQNGQKIGSSEWFGDWLPKMDKRLAAWNDLEIVSLKWEKDWQHRMV